MNTLPQPLPPKRGFKTSEFWLVVAFTALAHIGPLVATVPGQYGILANAVVIGLYALSRGKAKSLGYYRPALSTDPEAKLGILVELAPQINPTKQ